MEIERIELDISRQHEFYELKLEEHELKLEIYAKEHDNALGEFKRQIQKQKSLIEKIQHEIDLYKDSNKAKKKEN